MIEFHFFFGMPIKTLGSLGKIRVGRVTGNTHIFFFGLMIQSFRTDRSGQTVQTQIRLLLEEQSDQGLHCLLFHLHLFDEIPKGLASLFEF